MTLEELIQKNPKDSNNLTLIPLTPLVPENMDEWMIGLRVSFNLKHTPDEDYQPINQGEIRGYDDEYVYLTIGGKKRRRKYDPLDMCLCVYQFRDGLRFMGQKEYDAIVRGGERKQKEPVREPPKQEEAPPPAKKRKQRKPRAKKRAADLFGMEK